MNPQISVTIATGGSAELLRGCVESLFATAGDLRLEVIVVDNCARYDVGETLRDYPVIILRNDRQLGLATNENRAIQVARGEFLFWLNDDTLVQPGCMQHLVAALQADPKRGAALPRLFDDVEMLKPQANVADDFPKPFTCFVQDLLEETPLIHSRWGRRVMKNFYPLERSGPVKACGGAAILFRREAVHQIGPMDEDYGMYYEETDWCRRLTAAGWTLYGVAEARVVHFGGQTTRSRADFYSQMQRRSRLRYLRKFHPVQTALWMRLALPVARRSLALVRRLRTRRVVDPGPPPLREQLREMATKIKQAQGGRPLVYLDVGSAAAEGYWTELAREGVIQSVFIDMAEDWGGQSPTGAIRHVRAGLGDKEEEGTAYLTAHPGCSSCLPPNMDLLREYPVAKWFEVVDRQSVQLRRYDTLAEELQLPSPDVVKIDVQGFEGRVLEGFGDYLEEVLCLEFECQFKPLYVGQELFDDLYRRLTEKGFVLRDLKPQGPFEGEALEFNSFWSRRPKDAGQQQIVRLWEKANQVWPGVDFPTIDQHERARFKFRQVGTA